MTKHTIRFYQQGALREVRDAPASRTVLQHLREDLHCTGTKEGCAEGDCGACTVVVGELDANGTLALKAVNACIQFLPTLDGRALFTVEDLRAPDGALHPVQQSMVDCHGLAMRLLHAGFVMSMWALYENRPGRCRSADTRRDQHRAVRQPVPLHRLPADCRCGADDVRLSALSAGHARPRGAHAGARVDPP